MLRSKEARAASRVVRRATRVPRSQARMAAIRRANNIRQNVKNQIIDNLLRPDDLESVGGGSQSRMSSL